MKIEYYKKENKAYINLIKELKEEEIYGTMGIGHEDIFFLSVVLMIK